MANLTILESESFREELIKRSPEAEYIVGLHGSRTLTLLLREAFALKQEYDEKIKGKTE